jgi:hypothetical protein
MRTAFEREGDVRSVDLLGAFATLWRDGASGVVRFSGPHRTVRFDVSDGDLVAVSSSDDSFDTAEILRRAEKLSADALADGRIPPGTDRARYLRDIGLLSDRDWRWGEKLRIVEILSDLVNWLDGTYRYVETATPEPSDFQIGIDRVILELYLRSSDREFIHHSLGAPETVLVRAGDFDEKFSSLGLTPDALEVAAAIDGRSTAAEISGHTPPDPFSVEKLLAALATLGLVHPEYALETPRIPEAVSPAPRPPEAPAALEPEPEQEPEPEPESEPEPEPIPKPEPEWQPAPAAEAAEPVFTPLPERLESEDDLELLEMPAPAAVPDERPALDLWEAAPAEPLDQPLAVVDAPDFGADRRRSRSPVWLLILLAVGVGALLLLRSREPSGTSRPVPPGSPAEATPAAIASPSPPAAAPAIPVFPTAVALRPTTAPTAAPTATAAVAPSPAPTAIVSRPTPAERRPRPAVSGAPRSREDWLALADRDRGRLASDSGARFTIQLELVCELPSLEEAWVYDREGTMWLLPAEHRGRTCFRVFWGRYRTLEDARAAKSSVPPFFFTPTNRPVVVSTSGALLR